MKVGHGWVRRAESLVFVCGDGYYGFEGIPSWRPYEVSEELIDDLGRDRVNELLGNPIWGGDSFCCMTEVVYPRSIGGILALAADWVHYGWLAGQYYLVIWGRQRGLWHFDPAKRRELEPWKWVHLRLGREPGRAERVAASAAAWAALQARRAAEPEPLPPSVDELVAGFERDARVRLGLPAERRLQ